MIMKGWYKTMKKEEFVKLGIDEETAKKCEAASLEELKGFIPKARFDEVNTAKNTAEALVKERDGQLETLKNSTGDVESLKKQIETLQADNKAKDDAHAAEIKQLKIDAAVEAALTGAKAKNSVAVKALLKDLDKAELSEDGTIKGLAEQIEALRKSDEYLFEAKSSKNQVKGAKPGEAGNEDGDGTVDTSKMTYSELAAYLAEIPDAKGGHGGGDPVLLNDLFGVPVPDPLNRAASHIDGAMSIMTGIAANKSIATGLPVKIKDLIDIPKEN